MSINRATVNLSARIILAICASLSFLLITATGGHGVLNFLLTISYLEIDSLLQSEKWIIVFIFYGCLSVLVNLWPMFTRRQDIYFRRIIFANLYCLPWVILAIRSEEPWFSFETALPFLIVSMIELIYAFIWKYRK
jgi:hypothetical protein